MLTSWHNFFFFFVSVDKPPPGLWIQAASACLFGFGGLSLLLPQTIAGALSVALLYHLAALAVTSISIAVQRNNVMDALLTLLLAAWTFVLAAEKGSLRWLLLGALVVGLGFNIKMPRALLVLPAFYLLYLLATHTTWRRRFLHLGTATVMLLAVSLSWAANADACEMCRDENGNQCIGYYDLERRRSLYNTSGVLDEGRSDRRGGASKQRLPRIRGHFEHQRR